MTSRSQNPELYNAAKLYTDLYRRILDRHGIDSDTRLRIGRNSSSWTLRRFGQMHGRLLLACDRVHSELVGRATGIWPDMLQRAIQDALAQDWQALDRARKYHALSADLAEWLRGLNSKVRNALTE